MEIPSGETRAKPPRIITVQPTTVGGDPDAGNHSRGGRVYMRMPIRLCFFLLLLLMASDVRALDSSQPVESYIRTRFTNEDGLPANIVDDIVQSQDGFLWVIVNRTSLTRFDGRHFTAFDQPSNVLALALAPDGDLWVGTRDDLERIPAAALNQFGRLPAISYHPAPGNSSQINYL